MEQGRGSAAGWGGLGTPADGAGLSRGGGANPGEGAGWENKGAVSSPGVPRSPPRTGPRGHQRRGAVKVTETDKGHERLSQGSSGTAPGNPPHPRSSEGRGAAAERDGMRRCPRAALTAPGRART